MDDFPREKTRERRRSHLMKQRFSISSGHPKHTSQEAWRLCSRKSSSRIIACCRCVCSVYTGRPPPQACRVLVVTNAQCQSLRVQPALKLVANYRRSPRWWWPEPVRSQHSGQTGTPVEAREPEAPSPAIAREPRRINGRDGALPSRCQKPK